MKAGKNDVKANRKGLFYIISSLQRGFDWYAELMAAREGVGE